MLGNGLSLKFPRTKFYQPTGLRFSYAGYVIGATQRRCRLGDFKAKRSLRQVLICKGLILTAWAESGVCVRVKSPPKEPLGCRAGAGSGTTAPTPTRPYRG